MHLIKINLLPAIDFKYVFLNASKTEMVENKNARSFVL